MLLLTARDSRWTSYACRYFLQVFFSCLQFNQALHRMTIKALTAADNKNCIGYYCSSLRVMLLLYCSSLLACTIARHRQRINCMLHCHCFITPFFQPASCNSNLAPPAASTFTALIAPCALTCIGIAFYCIGQQLITPTLHYNSTSTTVRCRGCNKVKTLS